MSRNIDLALQDTQAKVAGAQEGAAAEQQQPQQQQSRAGVREEPLAAPRP
jgi:hypothetical protein